MINSPVLSLDGPDDAADSPMKDTAPVDIHAQAILDYEAAFAREEENILEGYEDVAFLASNQWDPDLKAKREAEGRPCLTINRLPQFCRQITGDIRQMRPSIKVVPVDSSGTTATGKVIEGMVRYIENRSSAKAVYFQGADGAVHAGRGAWRVETEYASDTTCDQEIRISPIEDGLAVMWDPDSILPGHSDAMFCFVSFDLSRRAFERKYPDKSSSDFGRDDSRLFTNWFTEDTVRVAEYWWKEEIQRTLIIGAGKSIDVTEMEPEQAQAIAAQVQTAMAQGVKFRMEKRKGHKVRRALISGSEILEEPMDWPGKFIPIVTHDGEELRIGRRLIRHGAVRNARDPQRLYNYYLSAHTEVVALQPKAPFMATEANVEQNMDMWERANVDNQPVLIYTPDPLNGGAAPQRVQPPVSSSGITEGLKIAEMDLQATTGIYNAALGAQSNETSGKAITARQREGDTGTYVYVEHFEQALVATGKIIVDLIPHVYDTTREMRIIGDDGTEEIMPINQPAGLAMLPPPGDQSPLDRAAADRFNNDVTVGTYDVVVEMGPSFNTRREEARDGMIAFLQSAPQMAPVVLDLIAKQQDWPLADEIRERIEAMAPPQIQALMNAKKKGPDGQPLPPPPPPPPPPEVQMQMAQQQREQELAGQQHELNVAKLQVDMHKIQAELAKASSELEASKIDAATRLEEARHTSFQATADVAAAHASAAGKAGAAAERTSAASDDAPESAPAAGGADPRVDGVIQSVKQLDDAVGAMGQMLQQILGAIQGGAAAGGDPGPAANDPVPPVPGVPGDAPAGPGAAPPPAMAA